MSVSFSHWYLVVRYKAVAQSGLTSDQIPSRIYSKRTISHDTEPFMGQDCTLEDDGEIVWQVARSVNIAPDGFKKVAYVVAAERYLINVPQEEHAPDGHKRPAMATQCKTSTE